MTHYTASGNIKSLRDRVGELRASARDLTRERAKIGDAAIAEKRELEQDERDRFAAAGTEIDAVNRQLTDAEQLLAAAEEAADAERAYVPVADPDGTAAAEAARAARSPRVEVTDRTNEPGFFGRQLQAVRNAALSLKGGGELLGSDRDVLATMQGNNVTVPAMQQMAAGEGMQAAATGLNTDVPSEGGFLVGQQRTTRILQRSYSQGQILSRIDPMPIGAGSNGMTFPAIDETSRADNSRFGGIVSGWLGQGNSLTAGKPKFRQMDMKLRKVGAYVYATDEQISDGIALEGWINRFLPLELTFRTEDAVINGTGSNQPQGVVNSGCVISLTRTTTGRIVATDLRAMVNRMWAPLWTNAVFLVDQSTLGEFDTLAIPIGTAGVPDPSYKPAGSMPGQRFATYKNIPIITVEYMAALGSANDIVLTNFDEYFLIDKGGVNRAVSLHVAFLTDEAVFRFIYRVDGQIHWNAALTPKSGGDTLSAVLSLAA